MEIEIISIENTASIIPYQLPIHSFFEGFFTLAAICPLKLSLHKGTICAAGSKLIHQVHGSYHYVHLTSLCT
jgi:hypothetical protein